LPHREEVMYKIAWVWIVILLLIVGCSQTIPVSPDIQNFDTQNQNPLSLAQTKNDNGPYRLYGEWTFYIDETHTTVDAVPVRSGRFHLNALKFLEEYCTDCLRITNLKNNGDSTIDLTVQITHPFNGFPQYTGFDVKGIIMFDGSWENEGMQYYPPYPEPFRVSWRELGDPQLLNADGYTLRWSPWYDSGSNQPIFRYWEGRYASGTPTANLNGFKNFYTHEERHYFAHYGSVSRTYHIWLPPGPVVAGYAVEACWEPPTVTPVKNPVTDFPITANQPEAYEFYYVLNNGEPITEPDCCGQNYDPSEAYAYMKAWGHSEPLFALFTDHCDEFGGEWPPCGDKWPNQYCADSLFNADRFPDGDYIGVLIHHKGGAYYPPYTEGTAYTVFEFTIDLQ